MVGCQEDVWPRCAGEIIGGKELKTLRGQNTRKTMNKSIEITWNYDRNNIGKSYNQKLNSRNE